MLLFIQIINILGRLCLFCRKPMDEYDKRKEKYMKGITKKIVSILLAVALVITSLQYTPKTVSAATEGYTEVMGSSIGFEYKVDTATLDGWVAPILDGGDTLIAFQYAGTHEGVNTVIKVDGVETSTGTALVNAVMNGKTLLNMSGLSTDTFTTVEIINGDKQSTISLRKITVVEDETEFVEGMELFKDTQMDPADVDAWQNTGLNNISYNNDKSVSFEVPEIVGGDNHSSQFKQTNIKLEADKWYKVAYTVTSDVDKTFQLLVQNDGNWNVHKEVITSVKAGETVTVETTFTGVSDDKVLVGIMMGYVQNTTSAVANVTIKDFSLTAYTSEPTTTEEPSEPVSTISSLDEIEDAYIYNFVEAGEGFIVGFEDPNEDAIKKLPAGTEYTYKYVLNVNGTDIEVAEPGVAVDLSSLGLVDGTEYDVTMKAVYTEGETSMESPASVKTKFTYKTGASTVDSNGIAQVFFTTSSNPTENLNVNGLYEGSENNKPKIPTAIVVKDAEGNREAFDYGTANVRGNSTANAAKKPYNFKFTEGKNLFGMGKAKKWSLLANIFDKTLMRNQIGMDFQRSLEESQGTFADGTSKVFTSECQPVDLYIDGVYAGTYTLIESVETGSSRVDIDIDGIDEDTNEIVDESKATSVTINETSYQLFDVLLELGNDNRLDDEAYYFKTNTETFAVNEPARENKNYDYAPDSTNKPEFVGLTQSYVKDFETALANDDYDLFSQYIDVDSFVDFYITSEYFMTKDIGFSSTRFYIKDGKMYAGPLWDLDLSSGNNGANPSAENFYAQDSFRWFKNLMANETFAAKVKARYTELQPQIKALYATGGKVDQAYETVKNSAEANYTEAYAKGENNGWGYTFVYGNSGYFDQAIHNLTIQQANASYGVYGTVNVYNNYADYITEYKTWLKNRNEWLVEQWDIELVTGLNKNSQGDVVVTWDAVNGATGYAITYTPAILPETAQLSVFDVSPIAALAELGETTTVYIADGTTTSYNFSDNNIQLADNSKVTVAYTTDATVDATATYAEVLEEEATSEIALLNRVTVDGLNATIVTNVTNNGTAVAENVVLTMNDANGNAIETKTVEAIGVGTTATVAWNREETAGNYTYTIETGLLSSGVSYACDDIANLTYGEDTNLTANKEGATYAVVGKVPETDFKFNADGYLIETGAADQAIYVRLNGEVVASNESGNSAMNYTVKYADLEYDTTNVIQIEYVDKAADMVTMTTYIQTVYVKVGEKPAEEEPDLTTVIANAMADTANWIQTGGRNNGAVSNSAGTLNYWIESSYYENGANNNGFFNGNIYGYYVTGTGVPYGGIENNTVKGEAFGISSELVRNGIDSVWISDGTTTEKLTDGTEDVYWNPNTDVFTITADRFVLTGDETEKVYYVTVRLADGSDYSWPVKVTKLVEQEPADIENPAEDGWVLFNSSVAANGDIFYVSKAAIEAGYVQERGDQMGCYNAPARAPYNNGMAADANTLSWVSAVDAGNWKSVWVRNSEGITKYTNDGVNASFQADCMHVNQNVFALAEGDTEEIFTVTVRGTADYTFKVKVVADGTEETTAEETTSEEDSSTIDETTTTVVGDAEPTEVIGLGVISQVGSDVTFSWGQTNEQILSGQSYKVYIDGEFYQEYVGATQVEYAFSTTGEHTIKVTANLNGKETEGATLNITINSVGTPDLVVSEVKILTEGELLPGQTIQVQITVKNQGTADAKLATGFNNGQALTDGVTNPWSHIIVHLRQWKDGEAGDAQVAYSGLPLPMVGENYVLAAGAASSVTFNYTIPVDADTVKYQIGGLADADNDIKDELDENNNKTFINLEIGEVVKIPEANLANDGNEISVSWDADANATGYKVSYVVDGVTYTTDTLTETTYNFTENNIILDNDTKVSIVAVGGDNDGNVIAEATALADLTIINMYASGTAYAGKTINITSTVKNIGTAKATSSIESERVVAVTITAVEFSAYNVADDGLLPNDTLNIVVGYTPTEEGTATVTGNVNDNGRIYETDRTPNDVTQPNNNTMSITMPVVEEGAVVLSPIEGTNNVLVTWKAAENTAVNEYVVAYTSDDIVKTSLDGDLVSLETNTMTYDEATNTYSAIINAPLDNNTMVYVYAIDPIDNTLRTIVGADMALVDLVIESIGEPLGEVRIGYKFNIEVKIKNQGTAQVKGSTSEIVDEFYPYTIPVMVKWENAEGETFAIHDEYHSGLLAGASQVITFEELAPTKDGDIVFNFKADSHSWAEGVYDGFNAESDENNNIEQKTIKVLPKAQVREMDWTPLYGSQDKDEDGNPVVHIANFTDWRNVEYKVLDTSINDMDFEDILTDFSGYGGSYISLKIDNAENHKIIEPDATDILDESTATMYFMQVLKETVDNFSSTTIDYGEPRKKADGVLNNFDTNTNGINLHTRSFAPGKHYILKVENGDGEFLTMALRVPGDLEKWVQAKGDANTDENALPFVYHRGDLEVTGGFYYDATDLGLALISAYNGNWLVLTTDGTKTLAPNENWKLEIRYASLDENGEFVPEISDEDLEHIEKDPGIITLVPTDGVLRREGENTVHVSLPYLIQQIPIHSMNGGATDSEYYLLKLYNDADSTEYINIPVRIIANIPEIEPITGLTASLRGEELGVAWDNPNAEYKYDVYIQHECTGDYVLLKENATVEDVYSADIDGKAINFDENNNIRVVATWCEQTTEATYLLKTDLGPDLEGKEPPAREDKWVLINGEHNLPVTDHLIGNDATVNANIYYYTDVDISNVVGYNGAYIAINGNEDYFAGAETKLYVQKDGETPLVLEATRIYDKLYPGQIQVDASKMFETYGTYAEGYTWDGTTTLYYTIRVVGEDGTSKDFYFKIVPNEPEQQVNDKGEWVPLKGDSKLPVTFKYNHTYTAVDGTVVTEQKELPIDGYIEYYDHQSLTNTYTATGYNSYFVSLIGMTDIYSGAGTVKLGVANTGTFDNQDMIKEGGNAAEQTYTDAVIYDQLYPGEVQINAGQVFTVTNTTTYFMLKITGQTTSADGTTTETTKYLPIRITVETGDVEIRGFQMNTNTAEGAVSEFNPSFRVVSRAAKIMTKPSESLKEGDDSTKLYGVVNYGTMYAVDSSVTDAEMTLDNEGVRYVQATAAGTLQNWSGSADDADKDIYSYYALTFKSTTYYLDTLTFKYKLKAYAVLDDGTAVYQTKQMSETSIEDIAEELYNEGMMLTEEAHEFLYNHVLNIIAITKNRDNIGQAMFNALQPTSTSDERYILMNNAYKDLFYYVKLTREYEYDRYSQRETFKSLTPYDANGDGTTDGTTEEYLLPLLSEVSQKEYDSVADWIDENVTDGFYEKVTWKGADTTPGDAQ